MDDLCTLYLGLWNAGKILMYFEANIFEHRIEFEFSKIKHRAFVYSGGIEDVFTCSNFSRLSKRSSNFEMTSNF